MSELTSDVVRREMFKAEVRRWAARVGVEVREIHLRPMRRKWASASSRGRLTFSTELLSQPLDFQREVIVHELVHLKLMRGNHDKLFKSLVRAYLGSDEQG
ncbi:MAG TPA: M48 family metallopeptidase [Caldilineae bacterium]|nr:M48 family metallopeptidase [Caldilineae bacterium]